MNKYLSEKIKKLEEYVPNEAVYRIRLDANESPFPVSDDLKNRFADAVTNVDYNRYPDPAATNLIQAYADAYSLSSENIVAGNGSDELISIICTSFLSKNDRVLFLAPDFSMYAFYSGIIEAEVVTYPKTDKKYIDFEQLKEKIKNDDIRMVIFSNPCNPTGIAYKKDVIADFVSSVDCLCVVDEAYMEFSRDVGSAEMLHDAEKYSNLIILKTLSKAFGLAALRIGFAVSNREIIKGIKKIKSPYNVNSVSQALGTELLKTPEVIFSQAEKLAEMTDSMYRELEKLKDLLGFEIYPTETNFNVLRFQAAEKAKQTFEKLCSKGIAVRYIMGDSLRITCGTEKENGELIEALNEIGNGK